MCDFEFIGELQRGSMLENTDLLPLPVITSHHGKLDRRMSLHMTVCFDIDHR